MKLNKFLAVGCVAALYSLSPTVMAKASQSEDFDINNAACTITLNDSSYTRFINVNYIRSIQVSNNKEAPFAQPHAHEKVLRVSMASNYNNNGTSEFNLTYPSKEKALQALNDLRNKIDDCQYDAAERRSARKKAQTKK